MASLPEQDGVTHRLGAYLGANYPSEAGSLQLKKNEGIDLIRMFPQAFTMVCFMIFLVPTWLILTVAENPALSYFVSRWALVVLIVPFTLLIVHVVHVRTGLPNKFGVIFALILPSLTLLVVANRQYMHAVDLQDKLFSVDCDTFPRKRHLQESWNAAYKVYMGCLNATAATSKYSLSTLQQSFRIQDCAEYESHMVGVNNYADEWTYLRGLEEAYYCSGWCYHGVQLWSSKPHKDSCSVVVSHVFRDVVKPHMQQVSVIMLCVFGVTAVILIVMGPALRKQGIEW